MTKLLINNAKGIQELIEVGEGGGYFDPSKVLWDERTDGKWDSANTTQVGGLVRSGQVLVFDPTEKQKHDDALAAKASAINKQKTDDLNRISILKDVSKAKDFSELKTAVTALVEYLKIS